MGNRVLWMMWWSSPHTANLNSVSHRTISCNRGRPAWLAWAALYAMHIAVKIIVLVFIKVKTISNHHELPVSLNSANKKHRNCTDCNLRCTNFSIWSKKRGKFFNKWCKIEIEISAIFHLVNQNIFSELHMQYIFVCTVAFFSMFVLFSTSFSV